MYSLIAIAMLGCTAVKPGDSASGSDRSACREGGGWVADERSMQVSLAEAPSVQLLMPASVGRYPDGAPAVVFLRGGWETASLPAQDLPVHFGSGRGVVHLYVDLEDDQRGADSRAAVAAVVRYAAGEQADSEGCFLEDRSGLPSSGQLVIAGYSNGGNLAWSTLADPELSLPAVDGLVLFESPTSAQVVLFDLLRIGYEAGDCSWSLADGLSCGLAYENMSTGGEGILFSRVNQSAVGLGGLWDPKSGLWMPSPQAAQAAENTGVQADWLAGAQAASDFWREREATRLVGDALSRFPDLAVVVAATEEDHAQAALPDAPHVTGMMAAMAAEGVRWHRLNPDASYAVLETGSPEATVEHLANTVFAVQDNPARMPESVGAGRGLITAASLELLDRAHEGEWAVDLEQILYR